MKKFLFSLLIGIFLSNFVLAADAAYILKNPSAPNAQIINSLNELNLTYSLIDDSQITSTNFSNYEMLIMGDENFGTLANSIPVNQKNSLFLSRKSLDEWHWANGYVTKGTSQAVKGRVLMNNSITKGFSSPVTLTTSKDSYYVIPKIPSRARSIDNIISTDNFDKYPILASVEPGDALLGSYTSKARGVYFGITNTANWNENSKEIFKRAISWVLYGEDKDKDGFFSDDDCNDNNSTINPDAVEIPYDGIDNDCSNGDLKDVDGDGYNSSIVGGSDCNDNDLEIHPGAIELMDDIDQNCANDSPIFSGTIQNITWNEDENLLNYLDLDNYFSDPDGDDLRYTVANTSSNENMTINGFPGNIISFTSDEDWFGQDWVILKADDSRGGTNISNYINLEVLSVNDAPILEEILDIKIVEAQEVIINFIAGDVDGDTINYTLSRSIYEKFTGNNPFIWQTQLGDAGNYQLLVTAEDGNGGKDEELVNVEVVPKVVINEFELNGKEGEEWVELFNSNRQEVDLSNWKLWDGLSSPSLKHTFPEGTILKSQEYLIIEISGLNNPGEFITLYNEEGIIIDETPTKADSTSTVYTWQRVPNGNDTDSSGDWTFQKATEGINNEEDVDAPRLFSINNIEAEEGDLIQFTVSGEDLLGDNITLFAVNLPSGSAFDSVNGIGSATQNFTWQTTYSDAGTYEVTFNLTDGEFEDVKTIQIELDENDAPTISKTPDTDTVNIIEGRNQTFSVQANDIDSSQLSITWILDNEIISSVLSFSSQFFFSKPLGTYFLQANISDEEFVTEANWTVKVKPISDFTCAEVGGFVISEKEKCYGEILGVKDTTSCCSIRGVPSFKDADACEILNQNIEIQIKDPKDDDTFKLDDKIPVEVRVKNNYDKKQNFKVGAHLYNSDSDDSLDDDRDSVTLDIGKSGKAEFEFEIPSDIDTSETHYIFIKVEDDICNQAYVELDIERPDEQVLITEFDLPSQASCGEVVISNLKIENQGMENQDITLTIKSEELGTSAFSEFELEEFGEKDAKKEELALIIPQNTIPGIYTIEASVEYSSITEKSEREIEISCKAQEMTELDFTISEAAKPAELNTPSDSQAVEVPRWNNYLFYMILFEITLFAMIAVLYFLSLLRD